MTQIKVSSDEFKRMRAEGRLDPRTNPRLAAAAAKLTATETKEEDLDAFLEDGIVIAGYRCRPMTIASIMLLQRANSPLVTGEPSQDQLADAMTAIWILAGPEDAVLRSVRDPNELWECSYHFSKDIDVAKAKAIVTDLQAYLDRITESMDGDHEKKVVEASTATPSGESLT